MWFLIFMGVLLGFRGSGMIEMAAMSTMDVYYPKNNSTYVGSREWESKKGDWTL